MIAVNEIFYSVQGEGAWSGQPMVFVRVAGCNLRCSWCDQPDTIVDGFVDQHGESWSLNFTRMTETQVVLEVLKYPTRHVCLTGGEPTAHKLEELVNQLESHDKYIHIETNGTYHPKWLDQIDHITVSPKREKLALPSVVRIASELKFIFDEDWDDRQLSPYITYKNRMYLSPANRRTELDHDMQERALAYVMSHPTMKFNIQMHKVLGVR